MQISFIPALAILVFSLVFEKTNSQISFAPYISYPIEGTFTGHLATGDFNHDNRNDVVVRTGFGKNENSNWKLFVYLQGEDSTLMPPVIYYYRELPSNNMYEIGSIASGDVNNDGLTDIALAWNDSVAVFIQNNSGTLDLPIYYFAGNLVEAIKIGDVNNDGYNDIIASLFGKSMISALYGDPVGNLSGPYHYPGIRGFINNIEIARIGKDTLNSIVKTNGLPYSYYHTSIYKINIDKSLDTVIHYNVPRYGIFPNSFAIGNINGDDKNELIYACNPNSILVWDDLTDTTAYTEFKSLSNIGALAVKDLDCDKKEEICMLRNFENTIYILSERGGINLSIPCSKATYQDGLSICDINSDGKPDIVSCNNETGLSVLINTSICISTGNTDNDRNISHLELFPNPFIDLITIPNTTTKDHIIVSDITGKVLKTIKGENQRTIMNLNNLNAGIYFIKVSNTTYKIIKN